MIAKYPGKCRYCKKPIEVGRDEYEVETKTSFHPECRDSQSPEASAFTLATDLGFIEFSQDQPSTGLLDRMKARKKPTVF
jgi:hypothetical protein